MFLLSWQLARQWIVEKFSKIWLIITFSFRQKTKVWAHFSTYLAFWFVQFHFFLNTTYLCPVYKEKPMKRGSILLDYENIRRHIKSWSWHVLEINSGWLQNYCSLVHTYWESMEWVEFLNKDSFISEFDG